MTSQLLLSNQRGIVVASDTLTTKQGRHRDTTWLSNGKVVALPEPHRIIVAVSGRSFINKVQACRLLEDWSLSLQTPLPTLHAYADSFSTFAAEFLGRYDDAETEGIRRLVDDELTDLGSMTDIRNLATALRRKEIDQATFEDHVVRALAAYRKENFGGRRYDDLTPRKAKSLLLASNIDWVEVFSHSMRCEEVIFGDVLVKRIMEFLVELTCRFVPSGACLPVLHIAGFGADDRFAGWMRIAVREYYGGRLRTFVRGRNPTDPSEAVGWCSVAQSDAIDAYLEGIDSNFRRALPSVLDEVLEQMPRLSGKARRTMTTGFVREVDHLMGEHYAKPWSEVLAGLSVVAMAKAADVLLNLQALRSIMSRDQATVGGVIEVASVTRFDGVVWHRRIPEAAFDHSLQSNVLA
jgi:hypothetical protein